ncbi:MAG: UbiA family prenyltransferase [Proteobacteria bacterium]|nr:UbiA family prenyltransferase [Pseudomonadota bacterium]
MKRFFALSRTQHGIIDLSTTAFAALIWLGSFPDLSFTALALLTAFAGYTAIYALNDLMGQKVDKEKHDGGVLQSGYSVEASDDHHPLVQGVLSTNAALAWMGFWLLVALVGSWLLNPVIIIILGVGCVFEIAYCKLLKVTHWRILLSGVVKACGPVAAVFAVDGSPRLDFLLLIFAWVFMWEVSGQNIPADWNDVEEDKRIGAKTIPARFGPAVAANVILLAAVATLLISTVFPVFSPASPGIYFTLASLAVGYFLLLSPAIHLWKSKDGENAAGLFDKASYYPLAMLFLITGWILLSSA